MDYIGEIIKMISSGDEDKDQHHIKLVAENIHAKSLIMHKEYVEYLKECLKQINQQLSLAASENRDDTELIKA